MEPLICSRENAIITPVGERRTLQALRRAPQADNETSVVVSTLPHGCGGTSTSSICDSHPMKRYRLSRFLIGTALAVVSTTAVAQTTLPNGLVQSGGVIMMQPIPDGSTGPASGERRQAAVHFL